ncbi:unnamed protein product, partial [Owenia fusiformis]
NNIQFESRPSTTESAQSESHAESHIDMTMSRVAEKTPTEVDDVKFEDNQVIFEGGSLVSSRVSTATSSNISRKSSRASTSLKDQQQEKMTKVDDNDSAADTSDDNLAKSMDGNIEDSSDGLSDDEERDERCSLLGTHSREQLLGEAEDGNEASSENKPSCEEPTLTELSGDDEQTLFDISSRTNSKPPSNEASREHTALGFNSPLSSTDSSTSNMASAVNVKVDTSDD